MVKSEQIRAFVLSIVYFILLMAIFLPHHHHEETACYTTTHCEDDISGHDQHGDEPVDHHHDHEKPENPQPIIDKPDIAYISMGIYIFNCRTLIDALQGTENDFGQTSATTTSKN